MQTSEDRVAWQGIAGFFACFALLVVFSVVCQFFPAIARKPAYQWALLSGLGSLLIVVSILFHTRLGWRGFIYGVLFALALVALAVVPRYVS